MNKKVLEESLKQILTEKFAGKINTPEVRQDIYNLLKNYFDVLDRFNGSHRPKPITIKNGAQRIAYNFKDQLYKISYGSLTPLQKSDNEVACLYNGLLRNYAIDQIDWSDLSGSYLLNWVDEAKILD